MKITISVLAAMILSAGTIKAQQMDNRLDNRQKKICTIAVNTATGNLDALEKELPAGLDSGLTINEINEILIQMYAYCGFPRSLQGINAFMNILTERKERGIDDPQGQEPTRVTGEDKYQQGKDMLEQLTGVHETVTGGANAFAPGIDVFLKEHLFADIFGRGVLSYTDRELATVSCIASLGNVDPMLRSHFCISLNIGVKEGQLRELLETIRPFTGEEKYANSLGILNSLIDAKK